MSYLRFNQIYLLSLLGIFLEQLFADLHPVFANQYLHKVDSDSILICESYMIGKKTAVHLENITVLDTPKADAIINNMEVDQNSNITVEVEMKGELHKLTLNSKITRNVGLDQVKDGLIKSKGEIISCIVENIRDQNGEDSLPAKMDVFNLEARDDLQSRLDKLENLYDVYGQNMNVQVEKWFDFLVFNFVS